MGEHERHRIGMFCEYPWSEEDMNRGGVVQSNYRLVNALAGVEDVDLYVFSASGRVARPEVRPLGRLHLIFYPRPRRDALLLFGATARTMRRFIRQYELDLVHAQAFPHFIIPSIHCGRPHVVTIHGIWRNELAVQTRHVPLTMRLRNRYYARAESYYLARVKNLIAISTEIERMVGERAPSARVFRVDNPIDDNFFELPDRTEMGRVLFVGWVSHRKGVHVLLAAAEQLVSVFPRLSIGIAGAEDAFPEYVAALKRDAARLVERGNVEFLGPITQAQLYNEVSRCQVLCLPSLAESAPMVVSQAMAAGKPVVASRVGGLPDLIEDEVTGLLCPPAEPGALAAALTRLLRRPEEGRAFGESGRHRAATRHRGAVVAQQTIAVYRDVLRREGSV